MKLLSQLMAVMILALGTFIGLAPITSADIDCSSPNLTPAENARCGLNATNPENSEQSAERVNEILETVVRIFSVVVGVAALITLLVQGFRLTVSSGDSKAAISARNGIIYAIVGLAVALSASPIVNWVIGQL